MRRFLVAIPASGLHGHEVTNFSPQCSARVNRTRRAAGEFSYPLFILCSERKDVEAFVVPHLALGFSPDACYHQFRMLISLCPISAACTQCGEELSLPECRASYSNIRVSSRSRPMPRGRGRKRSIGQASSSRRTAPTSSSRQRARLRSPPSGLRRSARLAQSALRQATAASTEDTMTDIAPRTFHAPSVGSRAIEADLARQGARRPRATRSRVSDDRATRPRGLNGGSPGIFSLNPVDQLPSEVRAGIPLDSPFTLRVDRQRQNSSNGNFDHDRGRLMAVATLVANDGDGSSTPVDAGVLTGPQLADTVHPTPSTGTLGYVSFPDLIIRSPGTFRIRVTLLRMSATAHAGQAVSSLQGATSLVSIDSEPVIVAGA